MDRDQIRLVMDKTLGEGIRYIDRTCKNWQGGLKHKKVTPKDLTHYVDQSNPRNLVLLYQQYLRATPDEGRFYRRPLAPTKNGQIKFGDQPIGKNTLAQYVKRMFDSANISLTGRHITNHSIKATLCSTLWEAGFDNQAVSSRSGHRSRAVESYKRMRESMQMGISNALQPPRPKQSKPMKLSSSSTISRASSFDPSTVKPSSTPQRIGEKAHSTITLAEQPAQFSPKEKPQVKQADSVSTSSTKQSSCAPAWSKYAVCQEVRKAGSGNITIESGTKNIIINIDWRYHC